MTPLVAYLLLFTAVGAGFVLVNLVVGALLRPNQPEAEKQAPYECGEEATGSTRVRYDSRYYVIALLFVIFDVEVAFFFPWAEVFGTATRLARTTDDPEVARQAFQFGWLALTELALFFGLLLVGFAYLWGRGDLTWVRATTSPALTESEPLRVPDEEPVTTATTGGV